MTTQRTGRDARRTRLSLFARAQLPLVVSILILRLLMLAFGIGTDAGGLLLAGELCIVAVAVISLVLPWERWPRSRQSVLAVLDLGAVVLISIAMFGRIDAVAVLATFPALWLVIIAGRLGAAVGVIGITVATVTPVLLRTDNPDGRGWASALVLPGVLGVFVVAACVFMRRYDRAARMLAASVEESRAAVARSDAAAAESARAGAILRSVADAVDSAGLLVLEEDGTPLVYNRALQRFAELADYDDATGESRLMYEADQVTPIPAGMQPLARIRRGETLEGMLHWVGARGTQHALVADGGRVYRDDGTSLGALLVIQDITGIVRASRSREDALATLAHELRTPLTSIVGYTDLLLLDDLPATASARLEVILRNAEHLLSLTAVFLDGLHREAPAEPVVVRLSDLVRHSVDVLLATPGFVERDVRVDIDDTLFVSVDRDGIATVLTNLLGNAVKFSRPGDTIRVVGTGADAWAVLTVRNSGSHIDPADLERIFDRFYRGGNARREAVSGTGIGLAVSRDIARAHGGTLIADPVDDGASFTLRLPRREHAAMAGLAGA